MSAPQLGATASARSPGVHHHDPHLNVDGDARAALECSAAAFNTEAAVVTYGQSGALDDAAWAGRVVFGQDESPSGIRVMAFDVGPCQPYDQGANAFSVFLSGDDEEEITAALRGLFEGAETRQPLGPSAWSRLAGQLRDRFGVVWQLDLRAATPER